MQKKIYRLLDPKRNIFAGRLHCIGLHCIALQWFALQPMVLLDVAVKYQIPLLFQPQTLPCKGEQVN